MKNEDYGFIELFDKIDLRLVKEAEGEWENKKKTVFFHSSLAKAACVAVCVSLGALCLFQPQVQAAVKEFAGWIARIWQVEEDLSPYTEVINKEKTEDGFSLCLNEVILSDDKIYAAVTIDTEYPEGMVVGKTYVTINGADYITEDVSDQSEDIGQDLDEQVPHHFYTFTLKGKIPENVTEVELHFTAYRNDGDLLSGENGIDFDFAFSATNEELEGNVIRMPLDQTVTLQDGTEIRFKNLTLTKLDSRIEAELERAAGSEEDIPMDCYLEGWDSLGNPVWYVYDSVDGKNVEFVSDLHRGLPSVDSEWMELQFYFYERVDEQDQQPIDIVDGEEIVMEEDGFPLNRVDVGEPFRVMINQEDSEGGR